MQRVYIDYDLPTGGPNMLRMSEDSAEVAAIKNEDYTPGYLSTNTDFNPQTASFFYESSASAAGSASASTSTSAQYVVAKYQQQMQRQQYYPQSAAMTQQQRDYLIRREGTMPPHFATTSAQPGIHYYPRVSSQQQTGVATHPTNIPYPMIQSVMQQQRVQRNVTTAAGSQRVPILIRPRFPAGVQPQFQYGSTQVNVRPSMQYSGGEMYMRYDRELPSYGQYQSEIPPLAVNSFPVHQHNGVVIRISDRDLRFSQVPMHPAQLAYSQTPFEYPMHASDYNNNMDFQGIIKVEDAMDGQTAVEGGLIKRRKRPRKVKTSDITGEGEDAEGVPIRKRRLTNKRKKLSSETEGAEPSVADTNVLADGPPPPLTHGELLKQKKKNMAFPKGTFLVRYADLDSDEYAGHIWLVDNHQLLQKYTYDGLDASNLKIFSRTERYSGWLCTCPWLYHPLPDVRGILGNMEKYHWSQLFNADLIMLIPKKKVDWVSKEKEESKKAPEPEPEQVDTAEEAVNSDAEHLCDEHEAIMEIKKDLMADDTPLIKTEAPDDE
ncbi:hypothetical protein OSTOST_12215 [Ostertagia ostertagi]